MYWGRAIPVFLFVAILGAPIGGLVYGGGIGLLFGLVTTFAARAPLFHNMGGTLTFAAISTAYICIFSLITAWGMALWLAARTLMAGTFGYRHAVLSAIVANMANAIILTALTPEGTLSSNLVRVAFLYLYLLPPTVISALVCRRLLGVLRVLPPAPSAT